MAKRPKRNKFSRLAARLYGRPLAITAEKLQEVVDFFEAYCEGHRFNDDELREMGFAGKVAAYSDDGYDDDEEDCGYRVCNGVAVMPMHGVIAHRMNMFMRFSGGCSTEMFSAAFEQAMADDRVRAIVFDCDSPGGEVEGVDELSRQIFEARGRKPIVAVANKLIASAAYYLGSAADEIVAGDSSMIGSVGTVIAHTSVAKADSMMGRKVEFVFEGKHKVDGNSHQPLSKQGRETLQELVSAAYEDFVSAVARNRGISAETVKADFGGGKVFFGRRAVDAGLADRVGTLQEIIGELSERTSATKTVAGIQTLMEGAVDKKIKAALVALGLVAGETSDADATGILNAFCKARGVEVPASADAVVELLGSKPPAATKPATKPAPAGKPAAIVEPRRRPKAGTDDTDMEDDYEDDEEEPVDARRGGSKLKSAVQIRKERQIVENERARAAEVRERGKILGVKEDVIEAAVEEGDEIGEALIRFTNEGARANAPVNPVNGGGGIRPNGSEVDAFSTAAADAMFFKLNGHKTSDGKPLSQIAGGLRFKRTIDIAATAVQMTGRRTEMMDSDDIAKAFLEMGGRETIRISAASGPTGYGTASDYPNILSAVLGKIKDVAMQLNTATYPIWCKQLESVPDFKPKTIIATGSAGELDQLIDGDGFPEGKFGEEASWIGVEAYGRKRTLTPVMVANDDMQMFADQLQNDIRDHEMTLNRLCVNLLIGNPNTADGNPFFGTAHLNQITAGTGGAPSVAQSRLNRKLMRQQYDVGAKNRLRTPPSIVLTSSEWETEGEQTYLPLTENTPSVPTSDGSRNTFRGKVQPVVEQMLDDWTASAGQVWFAFADPRIVAAIVYMFQTGFEGGKIENWWEPNTRGRVYSVEGRMGAAIRNWRGAVRNSGGNVSF